MYLIKIKMRMHFFCITTSSPKTSQMIAHEQCLQPEVQQPFHVLLSPTVFKVNAGHGSGQFSRSVVSSSCHGYTCFIIIF